MRRLIALMGVAVLLVGAGCSGDDDDGGEAADDTGGTTTSEPASEGDPDAFCADLEGLEDIDPSVAPTQDEIDELRAAADTAPSDELADGVTKIADLGEQLVDLDLEDQEAIDAANERASDPEVIGAATALGAFTRDECGFDIPIFSSLAGTEPSAGGADEGADEDVDTGAVRDALASSAPDVDENLIGISDINGTYVATIVGVTEGEASDACDSISEAFVAAGYAGAAIQVADEDANVLAECES